LSKGRKANCAGEDLDLAEFRISQRDGPDASVAEGKFLKENLSKVLESAKQVHARVSFQTGGSCEVPGKEKATIGKARRLLISPRSSRKRGGRDAPDS